MKLSLLPDYLFSTFVQFYFLSKMLTPRLKPWLCFFILCVMNLLISFINVNLGLYLVFPQEVLFLIFSIVLIHFLFKGKNGKKLMTAIFTDGLNYTAVFLFLPLVHFMAGHMDNFVAVNLLYRLNDLARMVFCGGVYVWISHKYRNIQGNISMSGNLYLLILAFFVKSAVTFFGVYQMDQGGYTLLTVLHITIFAAAGVTLLIFSLYYVDRRLVLALVGQQNAFLEKQTKAWKENEKQLSAFRHDSKNHLMCLKGLLRSGHSREAEEYINAITHTVSSFSPEFSTGNVYGDAVLGEKLALAGDGKTILETDMILPSENLISPLDLSIILNNGLDNALEACRQIPEGLKKRNIKAVSYVRHSCLIIEITNPLPPSKKPEKSLFQSTKENSTLHGIGLSNVREAVERLNGTLDLSVRDGWFCFCVMLPLTLPSSEL